MLKKWILLLSVVILTGCETQAQKYTDVALDVGFKDIAVTFVAYTDSQQEFDNYFALMVNAFTRYGHLFDKYNHYPNVNNLKTLNDNAGLGPMVVDQAIIDLLMLSKDWSLNSQNTFDPSIGAVLNLWHDVREEGKLLNQEVPQAYGNLPTLESLQAANTCSGWDSILIDDTLNTVEYLNPCTAIDVGGIGKGYAADLVSNELIEAGLEVAIINIGDSSIKTIGSKPDGKEWGIGITKPTRPTLIGGSTLDTLYFPSSISISTSGDNQNYFIASDGQYYHHLIDPKTLFPTQSDLHAVTIATDLSAADAEALSKILFILPFTEAETYLTNLQNQYPDQFIGALWVFEEGKAPESLYVKDSEGFSVIHSSNLIEHSRLYR